MKAMKQIETIAKGQNFEAVNIGSWDEVIGYELPMGPNVLHGKVQTLAPGQDSGFLHTHKTHEELYIIIKGEGLYQVDGEIFPVLEGSVIRVSPDGKRALKNNGKENMTMLCIQYKANAFGEADSPRADGNILREPLNW